MGDSRRCRSVRSRQVAQLPRCSRDRKFQLGSRDFQSDRQTGKDSTRTAKKSGGRCVKAVYGSDDRDKPAAGEDADRRVLLVAGVICGHRTRQPPLCDLLSTGGRNVCRLTWELPELSDDRLMRILQLLAVLLFVSVGALSFGRTRYPWAKWARWGAVAAFSIACLYALGMTLRWALGKGGS